MSITKWKNSDDLLPSFSSFFDDFLPGNRFNGNFLKTTEPAVNISESEDEFEVEVAAPGLQKKDFNINIENNMLTISGEHKEEKEEKEKKKVTRREFSYRSFRRSFTLPETIQNDKIDASYNDGVLKIRMPKKEESKKIPPKKIEIS